MAKTQTFTDKLKKNKADTKITVKVIKGITSEVGSTRFVEKIVKIDDLAQLNNLDIN